MESSKNVEKKSQNNKRWIRYLIFIIVLLPIILRALYELVLIGLASGPDLFKYNEDYPEFFSIAVYSLLGIQGKRYDEIEVLEKDSKGRTLFAFVSNDSPVNDYETGFYSIIICQKTDSKYAYYYSDYNFITAPTSEDISEAEILELKARNDWEKELDESKMTKVKIEELELSDDRKKTDIFKNLVDFENERVYDIISLGKDQNNRWLYYAIVQDRKDYEYKRSYMLILNKDFRTKTAIYNR